MKYSITISDLTRGEVENILATANSGVSMNETVVPVAETVTPPIPEGTNVPVTITGLVPPTLPAHFTEPGAPVGIITRVEAEEAAVEIDKTGVPWDERIHSGSKKITTKGVWARRRGVQDAQFNEIVAELKTSLVDDSEPDVETFLERKGVDVVAAPPSVLGVPVTATPVAATPVVPTVPARDFQGLMQQISNLFQTNQVDHSYTATIVSRINEAPQLTSIATLTDVANDPVLIDYAWQCLEIDNKAA